MTIGSSTTTGAAGAALQTQGLTEPSLMTGGPGPQGVMGGRPFGPHAHHHHGAHHAHHAGGPQRPQGPNQAESRADSSANRGQWKGGCGGSENRPQGKPSDHKQAGGASNSEKGGAQDARLKSITDFVGQIGEKLQKMFSSMKSQLESFAKNKTSDAKQDSFFKNMAGQFDKLGQTVAKFKPAESTASSKPAEKPLTGYSDFQKSIGKFGDTMQKFFTGLTGKKTDDKAA